MEAEEEEAREERGGRWHYILMLVKSSRRVAYASWRSSMDCISAGLIGDLEAFQAWRVHWRRRGIIGHFACVTNERVAGSEYKEWPLTLIFLEHNFHLSSHSFGIPILPPTDSFIATQSTMTFEFLPDAVVSTPAACARLY